MKEWSKLWRVSFNHFLYRTPMCVNWHHQWNGSCQHHVGAKPVVNRDSDSPWICSSWCEKFKFYVLMSFDGLLLVVSEYSECYLINYSQRRLRRKTLWAHLSINTEVIPIWRFFSLNQILDYLHNRKLNRYVHFSNWLYYYLILRKWNEYVWCSFPFFFLMDNTFHIFYPTSPGSGIMKCFCPPHGPSLQNLKNELFGVLTDQMHLLSSLEDTGIISPE